MLFQDRYFFLNGIMILGSAVLTNFQRNPIMCMYNNNRNFRFLQKPLFLNYYKKQSRYLIHFLTQKTNLEFHKIFLASQVFE